MAERANLAERGNLTLVPHGERIEVQHQQRGEDAGYDWSCVQLTRTEAKWLAGKLLAWSEGRALRRLHPKGGER